MAGWSSIVLGLGALAAAIVAGAGASARADDGVLHAQLVRLSRQRVFFAHQSVGKNVLDGMERLGAEAGVPLAVVEVPLGASIPAGALGHAWVGENHRPEGKLEAFARAMDALPAPGVDVALVKLCYVDFTADTDAGALAARYLSALAGLQRRHPHTTFVHVTAPVTTVQGGVKALLKRLLGRTPYGLVENVRREEYNAILRRAYLGKEPLLDLARVEATGPDGAMTTSSWGGVVAPSLQPAYAADEGHLNAAGQARAARALLEVLASVPPASPAPEPR